MRLVLLAILLIAPAIAFADQTPNQQKNYAAAMLVVAAKQCSKYRADPAIFEKGAAKARSELTATGVPASDIDEIINAAASDPDSADNPVACAVYDNAMKAD